MTHHDPGSRALPYSVQDAHREYVKAKHSDEPDETPLQAAEAVMDAAEALIRRLRQLLIRDGYNLGPLHIIDADFAAEYERSTA